MELKLSKMSIIKNKTFATYLNKLHKTLKTYKINVFKK